VSTEIKESTSNFYIVIPATVIYDMNLSANAKIMYGLISGLTNEKGYCWASNKYFAEKMGVSKTAVSLWIKNLKEAGYITVEFEYKDESKEVEMRKIWIVKNELATIPTINNESVESQKSVKKEKYKDEIKEIIDYLNSKAGSRYRYTSEGNNKYIRARLNEGYTINDFKTVIDKMVINWTGTEYEQYLRPSTLFGNKFENYLNIKIKQSAQNQVTRKEWDGKFYSDKKY
jgi:uncharacterized phage protein (TIGR02220 family)